MVRRMLSASNEASAAAPRFERDGFDENPTKPAVDPPVRSTGKFNPTLAVVVSTMIISFFLVGFATGYFKRWILGPEATGENDNFHRRRRRRRAMSKPPEAGLDPEVVSALPLVQYADLLQAGKYSEDCPVCLALFEATDSLRLLPQCTHVFHTECIDEWFKSHTTCPLCRACLANSEAEGAGTEDRDAEGDAEHGGIGRPADFDVVQVVIGGESSGADTAISGFSQEPTTRAAPVASTEEQEEEAQVNAASFIRAIRIGTSPAAKASIRRSSSVGTGLQLRPFVVDSEGTQHNGIMHAIALDHEQANELSTSGAS